jgi:hypothetical protein
MNWKTTFRKLDLFSVFRRGRDTPLLGPIEEANVNRWNSSEGREITTLDPSPHLKMETDPVSETCFLVV